MASQKSILEAKEISDRIAADRDNPMNYIYVDEEQLDRIKRGVYPFKPRAAARSQNNRTENPREDRR